MSYEIGEFLKEFLQDQGIDCPDGRLLCDYRCRQSEFEALEKLLQECGPKRAEDSERSNQGSSDQPDDFDLGSERPVDEAFDWKIRGFVLYASQFWKRCMNEDWRRRKLPGTGPHEKLKWEHFFVPIQWKGLYGGNVKKHRSSPDDLLDESYADPNGPATNYGFVDESQESGLGNINEKARTAYFQVLYDSIVQAWKWWRIIPLRLPTSVRYLDTIALQGGSRDSLAAEYKVSCESESEVMYEASRLPDGFEIDAFTIGKKALPRNRKDYQRLSITLLFGPDDGSERVRRLN